MQMTKFKALSIALVLSLTLVGSAAASEQWIHIKVEGEGDERVSINLPVSLLNAAAAMIPQEVQEDAHISLDELDMDWDDLMSLWNEVRDAPEATFVTVESSDETIKVRKEGDFLVVKTTEFQEGGAQVDMQFPLAVVDALLSGPPGTLDFQGALQALADHGPGNLISVRDGDQTVRVWIDDYNEAD